MHGQIANAISTSRLLLTIHRESVTKMKTLIVVVSVVEVTLDFEALTLKPNIQSTPDIIATGMRRFSGWNTTAHSDANPAISPLEPLFEMLPTHSAPHIIVSQFQWKMF